MPVDSEIIAIAIDLVRGDVLGGFDEILTPDPEFETVFSIDLSKPDDDLAGVDLVASSDRMVVVPWAYRCVHTGRFLGIPPTFIHFELRGATFVNVGDGEPSTWVLRRFIDFLCALNHIGIYTGVRPALNEVEYQGWLNAQGI